MKMRVISINLTFIAVGLLIFEFLFGGWLKTGDITSLNIPHDVDMTFKVDHLYGESGERSHYLRDVYGLRGSYPDVSRIDFLTIGGSATDQRYITEGRTWQDWIHKDFQQEGREISVVNAGIDGQSTQGHLLDFQLWFPKVPNFHPRFILLYLGVNDFFTSKDYHNDDLSGSHTVKAAIKGKSAGGCHKFKRMSVGECDHFFLEIHDRGELVDFFAL